MNIFIVLYNNNQILLLYKTISLIWYNMNKYKFNTANIYLGSCESKYIFNKENSPDFIVKLKSKLIGNYNYKTYIEKKIMDKNHIFISTKGLYKYNHVHSFVQGATQFYELANIDAIPNIQFNLKQKYNYEEINDIEEFSISDKITIFINNHNHVHIQVCRDAYWDETIVKLHQLLSLIGDH